MSVALVPAAASKSRPRLSSLPRKGCLITTSYLSGAPSGQAAWATEGGTSAAKCSRHTRSQLLSAIGQLRLASNCTLTSSPCVPRDVPAHPPSGLVPHDDWTATLQHGAHALDTRAGRTGIPRIAGLVALVLAVAAIAIAAVEITGSTGPAGVAVRTREPASVASVLSGSPAAVSSGLTRLLLSWHRPPWWPTPPAPPTWPGHRPSRDGRTLRCCSSPATAARQLR